MCAVQSPSPAMASAAITDLFREDEGSRVRDQTQNERFLQMGINGTYYLPFEKLFALLTPRPPVSPLSLSYSTAVREAERLHVWDYLAVRKKTVALGCQSYVCSWLNPNGEAMTSTQRR